MYSQAKYVLLTISSPARSQKRSSSPMAETGTSKNISMVGWGFVGLGFVGLVWFGLCGVDGIIQRLS